MDDTISTLCEELHEAREAKRLLLAQVKEIEAAISQLKEDVTLAMMNQGLQQCETGGYLYTLKQRYRVERQCDGKEFVRLFRENERSDLITEYVNASKLQSFVKNELQSHDELPAWLQGALLVEETNKLNIKKV